MLRSSAGRIAQRLAASAGYSHAAARTCGGHHLDRLLISTAECISDTSSQPQHRHGSPGRGFGAAAGDDAGEIREVGNDQVRRLAEEIMQLSLLEVSDLTEILQKRLNVQMPAMGAMGMAPAAAAPAAAPAAEAAAAAPEPAKTEFDVKLTGFEAASKVKIIKEVRTMTSLGLKEAKELVERAPIVLKAGVNKEEAEELQKKLEAVGAKIALE